VSERKTERETLKDTLESACIATSAASISPTHAQRKEGENPARFNILLLSASALGRQGVHCSLRNSVEEAIDSVRGFLVRRKLQTEQTSPSLLFRAKTLTGKIFLKDHSKTE
jgi:hypothetical protein